ncbi:hypothetical protein JHK82_019003 [Glycine max]|nr:hypothetical protein JHK85_019440 [Glycine max]KAG5143308.1 hypothetical protein JHK82_019003 [Glycine max]
MELSKRRAHQGGVSDKPSQSSYNNMLDMIKLLTMTPMDHQFIETNRRETCDIQSVVLWNMPLRFSQIEE